MNADCIYRIGRSHGVCQDYAVARGGERPCVILADGCSSSPDTDVGARLLVHAARKAFGQGAPGEAEYEDGVRIAFRHAAALGLDPRCLDATLLTLQAAQGRWTAAVAGDGVLAVGGKDGGLRVTVVSFPGGYPHYPSYLLDPARRAALHERRGEVRQIERWAFHPDGTLAAEGSETDVSGALVWTRVEETAGTAWAAILSDGAHSFTETLETATSRTTGPVPLLEVLRGLLAFKSLAGAFVQRRAGRFLQECAARGRGHYDDLSLAAIAF